MKNTTRSKKQSNRLKKYDADFLLKLAELLQNGFTQRDALIFLFKQYDVLKVSETNIGIKMAENGNSLADVLKFLGFRNSVISQTQFADVHGEIISNLIETSVYLKKRRETIKNIMKAVQYPLILLSIFIVMLVILNYTVIPQFNSLFLSMNAEKGTLIKVLVSILNTLPKVALVTFLIAIVVVITFTLILNQKNKYKTLLIVSKVPILRTYFKYYISHKFAREVGYLIKSGIELKVIIDIFKEQDLNPYLKIIAEHIEMGIVQGLSFSESVNETKYLDHKIYAFIKHGEINSNVGKELLLYSEYTIENMILRIERTTSRIQPVIFSVIGLLIVCLYLVIVLPVFQMMSQLN